MKKLYVFLVGLFCTALPLMTFGIDVEEYLNGESPYEGVEGAESGVEAVDLGKELQGLATAEDGILKQLMKGLGFDFDGGNLVVQFISNLINFLLSVIGLIALAILIFGFYKMFFSSDEDGLETAKKLIINTAIALAIIGLARFITNFLFDIYFTTTEGG